MSRFLVIHASVDHIQPALWRRLAVPADLPLDGMHALLQVAFDWEDCHMWQFAIGKTDYVCTDEDFGPPPGRSSEDAYGAPLAEALGALKKFQYWYDFGDDWHVTLKVERAVEMESLVPLCEAGERAGPPDDCGGVPGYYRLGEIMADSGHEEYAEMSEWLGGEWDPEACDLAAINRKLARVFKPRAKRAGKKTKP